MHWLWVLWFDYTYPSIKGNGPEAVVQSLVYAAIGYIFYPPFRNWVNDKFKSLHEKHDTMHEKLDHLIRHLSEVPDFPDKDK